MDIAIPKQVSDALGDDYKVIPSQYDDGPPWRDRILLVRPKRWFRGMREVGYIRGNEIVSGDADLLKILEGSIPGIVAKLIEWPESIIAKDDPLA